MGIAPPFFIFLPILLFPVLGTLILRNLGVFRHLSKMVRRICYAVSILLLFVLQRFLPQLILPFSGLNGLWLFFLYLIIVLVVSYINGNKSDVTLKKMRWYTLAVTVVVLVLLRIFVKG